jgi:diguanylate cyclase (GGDEF)-like protein/PAS domain S-box-containing protein
VIPAPLPQDEVQRLEALHRLQILDTESEQRFDRLTELASVILGTPIALVSLVDRDRQWFKSKVGMDIDETPRDVAFCAHAIVDPVEPFVVENALLDERFADNPFVSPDDGVRFYAGQVLHDRDGHALGTLCAVDTTPRRLTDMQREALELLGKLAEHELQRRSEIDLLADLDRSERTKSRILSTMTEGVILQDVSGTIVEWNPATERLLGMSGDQIAGRSSTDPRWSAVRRDGTPFAVEDRPSIRVRNGEPECEAVMGINHPNGTRMWVRSRAQRVLDMQGEIAHVLTTFTDITAEITDADRRHELEQALRTSEQTARVSLNALEQGVVLANPQTGVIHRINPAAEQILGYSGDELSVLWQGIGWQTFDENGAVLPMDERPIAMAEATGLPVIGKVVGWRRRDGQRILVRMSCIPNVDDEQNMVTAFTDITEDHLARRLLDATLDTAPVGLAILDHDRTILRCNPVFAKQAGRPAEELVGRDVVSLLDDEQRPAAAAVGLEIQRGRASGGQLDQRITRPDGTEIWVNTHLAVIADPDRPLTIAATFDVTEQRRMLLELSRFGYLFENANDIILIMGPAGEVIYVSPSVERVLGYPPGFEYVGGVLDMLHPDDLAESVTELSRFIAGTRASAPFTTRIRSYDGEWRCVECVAVNLLDEPAVGGIMLTARDTTERVQLTEQLEHQASHDALTGLPNRQLLEQRLEQALARVERTDETVGVCFLDLDGFKAINDSYGHASGDELLIKVAGVLENRIRVSDTAARIGGDEFVLILDPINDVGQAMDVTRRVRDAVLQLRAPGGSNFGSSVGLALSERTDTVASILKRADEALYLAKVTHDSSIELAPGIAHPVGL